MTSHSILGRCNGDGARRDGADEPSFFADLNLDQIVASITAGKEEYNLKPFFYRPLSDAADIVFRQEIMRELEHSGLFGAIKRFAETMRVVRRQLAQAGELSYERQKQRWFLAAAETYCLGASRLADDLGCAAPKARGLRAIADYLSRYVRSDRFAGLERSTQKLRENLAAIHYSVLINGGKVEVCRYNGERDYGRDVAATFERFELGAVDDYTFDFSDSARMNHIETQILEQVAKLYPEVFADLANFVVEQEAFADATIVRFDREVQFYISVLDYLEPLKQAGLRCCYPQIDRSSKEIYGVQGFDLALADKMLADKTVPVCNDFYLAGDERVIIVSGPNQGGKTTFARTFGQLHYLASLGCPVAGTRAKLFLFDELFTHFEKEEDITNLRGKLQDDLVRIDAILERATPNSIVIMNEIFTSTTFHDARALSRKIAAEIFALDLLCVWVTFLDDLSTLASQTVSMVSTVAPDDPAKRTYKILRQPADGLAYALAIAEKHRLVYRALKERLGP